MAPRLEDYVRATERLVNKILTCTQMPLPYGISAELEWQYLEEIHELQVELIEAQEAAAKQFGKVIEAPRPKGSMHERLAKFKKWLISNGVPKDMPIEFKADTNEGTGAIATRDIKKGEDLISIPRALMLTSLSAQRSERMRAFMQHERDVAIHHLLALHVLEQKFNTMSSFKPYIDVLPESFALPMYFDPISGDLDSIKGTSAVREVANALRDVLRGYALVFGAVNKSKALSVWQFTYTEWRWATSVIFTRQNFIPGYSKAEAKQLREEFGVAEERLPKQVLALIPGWDMLNNKEGLEITSTNDYDEGAQVCTAPENVKAGKQVYIAYAATPVPSRSRLARSGFVPATAPSTDSLRVGFTFPRVKDVARRQAVATAAFSLTEPFPLDLTAPLRSNIDNVIGTLACAFGTAADLDFLEALPKLENLSNEEMQKTYNANNDAIVERYTSGELECTKKMFKYIETQVTLFFARSEKRLAAAKALVDGAAQANGHAARPDARELVRLNAAHCALNEAAVASALDAHVKKLRESGSF